MSDNENKNEQSLFGDDTVKPLFGTEEAAVPTGKPLFEHEFSDPGDAAFVKPLFDEPEPEAEDETFSPEEIQDYEDLPETPESENLYELDDSLPESAESEEPEEPAEPEPALPPETEEIPLPDEPAAEEPAPEEPAAEEPAPVFAEESVPEPAVEEPVRSVRPHTTVVLDGDLEAMSLGALMLYARETAGVTEDDVYQVTKINKRFLEAIESDQFDKLPSRAFPGAYVRALCSFYHLDKSASAIAQKKAAAYCSKCSPPDEVYESMSKDAVINKEEQEKFRRILILAGVLLLLLILMTVGMIMMFSSGSEAPSGSPAESPVKMEDLEKLSAPPQMSPVETLKVPGK